jgi:hypothetical protein
MELSALIKRDTKKLSSSSIPLSLPPSPFLKLSHLSSLSLFLSLSHKESSLQTHSEITAIYKPS